MCFLFHFWIPIIVIVLSLISYLFPRLFLQYWYIFFLQIKRSVCNIYSQSLLKCMRIFCCSADTLDNTIPSRNPTALYIFSRNVLLVCRPIFWIFLSFGWNVLECFVDIVNFFLWFFLILIFKYSLSIFLELFDNFLSTFWIFCQYSRSFNNFFLPVREFFLNFWIHRLSNRKKHFSIFNEFVP